MSYGETTQSMISPRLDPFPSNAPLHVFTFPTWPPVRVYISGVPPAPVPVSLFLTHFHHPHSVHTQTGKPPKRKSKKQQNNTCRVGETAKLESVKWTQQHQLQRTQGLLMRRHPRVRPITRLLLHRLRREEEEEEEEDQGNPPLPQTPMTSKQAFSSCYRKRRS